MLFFSLQNLSKVLYWYKHAATANTTLVPQSWHSRLQQLLQFSLHSWHSWENVNNYREKLTKNNNNKSISTNVRMTEGSKHLNTDAIYRHNTAMSNNAQWHLNDIIINDHSTQHKRKTPDLRWYIIMSQEAPINIFINIRFSSKARVLYHCQHLSSSHNWEYTAQ